MSDSSLSDTVPMMRGGPSSHGLTESTLLYSRIFAAFASIGFAGLLVYTIVTDGSPFRLSLLTPWMSTTLVDYYLSLLPLYIVIYNRESRIAGTAVGILWVIICASLGACAIWAYVFYLLLRVRPGTPLSIIITGI